VMFWRRRDSWLSRSRDLINRPVQAVT
jgi:hypothetical protein